MRESRSLNRKLIPQLVERDGPYCHYCGKYLQPSSHGGFDENGWSVDHIIPVSRGGARTLENSVLCCRRCNSRKARKHYQEFRMALETDWVLTFLGGAS